jgi:hypothetical protein
MKLKLKDIKDSINPMKKLAKIELSFNSARNISEILIYLEKLNIEIEQTRIELVKRYGEELDDNWIVRKEFIKYFMDEWISYLEFHVEYPFDFKISLTDDQMNNLFLTTQEYILLKNIILE